MSLARYKVTFKAGERIEFTTILARKFQIVKNEVSTIIEKVLPSLLEIDSPYQNLEILRIEQIE